MKAAAESREKTLHALQLQLAESSRVAADTSDSKASSNAKVLQMTMKSEEAELDACVREARGVSWDALRQRTAAERLAAQSLAAAAKRELAAAVKGTDEAKAECERAAHRASEAARQLDIVRDVEEDAIDVGGAAPTIEFHCDP